MLNLRLPQLRGLLGVDEDTSFRAMYRRSMDPKAKLLEPFLSVLLAEGYEIGDVGRGQLEMNERRLSAYRGLAAAIVERVPTAVVVKGPGIADHYPRWLARGCVDLDLYVPDPADIWRAARLVAAAEPVDEVTVSVRRRPDGYDLFLGLSWDSPAAKFDARYLVEFATVQLVGDGGTVPSRPGVPADPRLRQLVLVAEEQFQRAVVGRDPLDAAVLLSVAGSDDPADWARQVADWRVAPEVAALLAGVDRHGLLDGAGHGALLRALRPWAEREEPRRREPVTEPAIEHGLLLSTDVTADSARFDEYRFGAVLVCPFGTYLLVTEVEVPVERYQLACAAIGVEPVASTTP